MSKVQKQCAIGVYLLPVLLIVGGCDSNYQGNELNEMSSSEANTESLRANIIISDDYQQKRRSFSSGDEYFNRLDQIENGDEITVNRGLYESLRHANTAAEISLLDMNGEVEIGEYVFDVREEASYRFKKGASEAMKELVQYYGLDGHHDLREVSEIIGNFALGQLAEIDAASLKDPQAIALYKNLLNAKRSSAQGEMQIQDIEDVICNYEYPNSIDGCYHYFHLNEVISWPGGGNLTAGNYEPIIGTFNQAYTSGLKKKGRGETLAWVRPAGTSNPYTSMHTLGATGSNAPGTIGIRFLLEVEISTGTGTTYDVDYGSAYAERSRCSNCGVTSRHWSRVDFVGNSSYPYFISNYYVP